ncbi:MAG: division/cell wall cluster transcriptional repressor MraZ [Elstera sp.]
MALFLSTFVNKVDKKGRVSVPAPFRATLADQPYGGILAYRSLQGAWIEAAGIDRLQKFSDELEGLDPDQPDQAERYTLLSALLGETFQLAWDEGGRVLLPQPLLEYAGIGEEAAFVGQGKFFLIRDPSQQRAIVEATITSRLEAKKTKETTSQAPSPRRE